MHGLGGRRHHDLLRRLLGGLRDGGLGSSFSHRGLGSFADQVAIFKSIELHCVLRRVRLLNWTEAISLSAGIIDYIVLRLSLPVLADLLLEHQRWLLAHGESRNVASFLLLRRLEDNLVHVLLATVIKLLSLGCRAVLLERGAMHILKVVEFRRRLRDFVLVSGTRLRFVGS